MTQLSLEDYLVGSLGTLGFRHPSYGALIATHGTLIATDLALAALEGGTAASKAKEDDYG